MAQFSNDQTTTTSVLLAHLQQSLDTWAISELEQLFAPDIQSGKGDTDDQGQNESEGGKDFEYTVEDGDKRAYCPSPSNLTMGLLYKLQQFAKLVPDPPTAQRLLIETVDRRVTAAEESTRRQQLAPSRRTANKRGSRGHSHKFAKIMGLSGIHGGTRATTTLETVTANTDRVVTVDDLQMLVERKVPVMLRTGRLPMPPAPAGSIGNGLGKRKRGSSEESGLDSSSNRSSGGSSQSHPRKKTLRDQMLHAVAKSNKERRGKQEAERKADDRQKSDAKEAEDREWQDLIARPRKGIPVQKSTSPGKP